MSHRPTYRTSDFTRRLLPTDSPFDQTETLIVPDAVQIMAAPPALPGLHYVSGFDAASVARHWAHLRKVQPRWMVAVGAGQFNEARDFARSVQNDPIRTNVIFRHWKSVLGSFSDNGRMNDLTGAEWIERVGAQHVNAPYWVMADNESAGVQVVNNTADLIPRASSVKLKLAVGAWSSHNPHKADWPLYMPLFEQLYAHPEHVYAPHIYYSRPPKSVENLDGFKLIADHLAHVERMMGAPIPFPVVITEYGRLANPDGTWLDPDKGYALEGINETEYADELIRLASAYPKWHFVVFSSGAWGTRGSLGVGKAYEERMEQYASGELPMPIAPISPPEMVVVLLHGAGGVKLREQPTTQSTDLAELEAGETVGYELPTVAGETINGNDQWLKVYDPRLLAWGYVSTYFLQPPGDVISPTPEPEPTPEPTPDPTPEPETQEQMVRRVMREENARFGLVLVEVLSGLQQTLRNSIENTISINVSELRDAIETYKQGDAA